MKRAMHYQHDPKEDYTQGRNVDPLSNPSGFNFPVLFYLGGSLLLEREIFYSENVDRETDWGNPEIPELGG